MAVNKVVWLVGIVVASGIGLVLGLLIWHGKSKDLSFDPGSGTRSSSTARALAFAIKGEYGSIIKTDGMGGARLNLAIANDEGSKLLVEVKQELAKILPGTVIGDVTRVTSRPSEAQVLVTVDGNETRTTRHGSETLCRVTLTWGPKAGYQVSLRVSDERGRLSISERKELIEL